MLAATPTEAYIFWLEKHPSAIQSTCIHIGFEQHLLQKHDHGVIVAVGAVTRGREEIAVRGQLFWDEEKLVLFGVGLDGVPCHSVVKQIRDRGYHGERSSECGTNVCVWFIVLVPNLYNTEKIDETRVLLAVVEDIALTL